VVIELVPKALYMGNSTILVCESIFKNPVLYDSVLACRNKYSIRAFGITWAYFGIGLGF
jgi:hypothetical protein